MLIKKILWLDPDTFEANMIIEDENIQLRVYAPKYEPENDLAKTTFEALLVENIVLVDNDVPDNVSFLTSGSYRSTVVGRVKSTQECVVKLGNIEIGLDEPFPGDIREGDVVMFTTARITMIFD